MLQPGSHPSPGQHPSDRPEHPGEAPHLYGDPQPGEPLRAGQVRGGPERAGSGGQVQAADPAIKAGEIAHHQLPGGDRGPGGCIAGFQGGQGHGQRPVTGQIQHPVPGRQARADEHRSDPRQFRVTLIQGDQVGARFEGGQVNRNAGWAAARRP